MSTELKENLVKVTYTNYHTKVFAGFYESSLFNSDTLYYINADDTDIPAGKEYDFTGNNYREFELDVCKKAVELLADIAENRFCNNTSPLYNFEFVSLDSPKYYNYNTDRININMEVDKRALEKYCFTDNKENFEKYLKDNYTSYDGFMSFISNNLRDFRFEYNKKCEDSMEMQVMIEYYLEDMIDNNSYYADRLFEYANFEAIYNYIELVDKK